MSRPIIILVKPQLAENIGMAARAMKNCCIDELRLVSPEQLPTDEHALRASAKSEEILQAAKLYPTTQDALKDLEVVYAATARPRHQVKDVLTAEYAAQTWPADKKVGVMFGCERTGLENEDISLADKIIEIPLNPEHSSLNLAQAVLIVCYEYYKTTIDVTGKRFITNGGTVINKEKLFNFINMLDNKIKQNPKIKTEMTETLLRNVNNIFTRAELTEQELNSLYGIVNLLQEKNH